MRPVTAATPRADSAGQMRAAASLGPTAPNDSAMSQ